jgi:hypothetical protein
LGRVHIKPFGQFGDRAFVADRGQGNLRLEGGGMISAGTSWQV